MNNQPTPTPWEAAADELIKDDRAMFSPSLVSALPHILKTHFELHAAAEVKKETERLREQNKADIIALTNLRKERDSLRLQGAELQKKLNRKNALPDSIQEAINSGDGTYKP